MNYLVAIFLGLIQALTEFLPISSSAHLILFRRWLHFDSVDGLTFDVALHLGTALALIAYFQRDIRKMLAGSWEGLLRRGEAGHVEHKLLIYILVGTVPAVVAGAALGDFIEQSLRNPALIVVTLTAGGLLFLVIERMARQRYGMEALTMAKSIFVGIAQSLALVPGVSRSGITIVAALALGFRREEGARFSFLLSVPAVIGAGVKKAVDLPAGGVDAADAGLLASGAVTSAVVGWCVIHFLLKYLRKHRLDLFAYYRFILAAAILLWLGR